MRTYQIAIANTYQSTNSPLIIKAGYYNTKMSGYKCITQLDSSEYKIILSDLGIVQVKNIININNITVMCKSEGNYTVFLLDPSQSDNGPLPFSFYAFNNIEPIDFNSMLFIFNQELPQIYSPTNALNAIDNVGTCAVLFEVYTLIYQIFYNSTTSIGVNGAYNSNWEFVYLGVFNLLQNATYPAEFIKTLMNINTQCSTQVFSTSITISRLIFQFLGFPVPVQMVYDGGLGGYFINIYYNIPDVWALGDAGFSELGDTTFLSSNGGTFLWVITKIILRLMPAHVKWEIQLLSIAEFNADFDVADVDDNDFYDPSILYDAYQVVNNLNNFNTQGYNLNV